MMDQVMVVLAFIAGNPILDFGRPTNPTTGVVLAILIPMITAFAAFVGTFIAVGFYMTFREGEAS